MENRYSIFASAKSLSTSPDSQQYVPKKDAADERIIIYHRRGGHYDMFCLCCRMEKHSRKHK